MVAIYHADRPFACCIGNPDQGDGMDGLDRAPAWHDCCDLSDVKWSRTNALQYFCKLELTEYCSSQLSS